MNFRKLLASLSCLVLVGGLLTSMPTMAKAHTYEPNSTDGHVLRLVSYVLHPIGIGLEWGITRPMHWLASQPQLDILMGHKARPGNLYFEWAYDDHQPGIAQYREQKMMSEALPAAPPLPPSPSAPTQ